MFPITQEQAIRIVEEAKAVLARPVRPGEQIDPTGLRERIKRAQRRLGNAQAHLRPSDITPGPRNVWWCTLTAGSATTSKLRPDPYPLDSLLRLFQGLDVLWWPPTEERSRELRETPEE